jgi:hypothetical protein
MLSIVIPILSLSTLEDIETYYSMLAKIDLEVSNSKHSRNVSVFGGIKTTYLENILGIKVYHPKQRRLTSNNGNI